MLRSEIETALQDPDREPSGLDGVPGWRRLKDGSPHPEDLRDIVDAVLKVTKPERVLLFGSAARRRPRQLRSASARDDMDRLR